jgi:hypothetical protein
MKAVALSLAAVASAAPPMPSVPLCVPETEWNPSRQCYNMCVAGSSSRRLVRLSRRVSWLAVAVLA